MPSRSMDFDRVIILKKCLDIIKTEARKVWRTETGGPLAGYVTENRVLIVVDAIGPGPKSVLERFSVTIDGEHAQRFCDNVSRESNGKIDYVGDWHKHPGVSLNPSIHDTSAMKTMANFKFSPTKHPISLIYRSWPRAFRVYVWDGSGALVKVPSSCQ